MLTSGEIRQQFIEFFVARHQHVHVPSSPVVPHGDPTLLFANAGMNQFKPFFLGTEAPERTRVANTQKCIRAGGKHNDLDDVGKDTYHHTFFEMLGNWSFGDYFKAEAIQWAWELLVDTWGLDPNRLHATYFEGDAAEGLEPDLEAKALWGRYLPDERIHPGNKKDNFWEMGDTGPCGPCSELHYDGTEDLSGRDRVNRDDPRVIEIWNLVFIQFNRGQDGRLLPLPAKHVDTGMGFERIVRVLQGKQSNYDTDVFTPIFAAIEQVTGARTYDGGANTLQDPIDIAYRVIADHIRCLTFALTDGAHCGNKGRDAVLRTILRRAVRFGHQQLGVEEPFFYKLVPTVVEHMGGAFPELTKQPEKIAQELKEEEESFRATLTRGIAIFERAVEGLAAGQTLAGATAFDLEATYGFPFSLTQVMAEERGLTVDLAGYEAARDQHADISRGQEAGADARGSLIECVQQGSLQATEFFGYQATEAMPQPGALQLFRLGGHGYEPAESAGAGDQVAVVLQKTPFYAEAGGQVGDTGVIQVAGGGRVEVRDTIKVGEVIFHLGEVSSGPLQATASAPIATAVDRERRARIEGNHTTTHVLNRALRDRVNAETMQKGSLVDAEKLRFDFSHNSALSSEQLAAVETQVQADIAADLPVYTEYAPQEAALRIRSLRAVFGEKYPPRVRVVSIGQPVADLLADPENANWQGYSIEFCGGTHLQRTGQAGGFLVLSEEGVAKGVRRITALTGPAAAVAQAQGQTLAQQLEGLQQARGLDERALADAITELSAAIDAQPLALLQRQALREGLTTLQTQLKNLQKERARASAGAIVDVARDLADAASGAVITVDLGAADAAGLRTAMDVFRKKHPNAAILLAGSAEGKVALMAQVVATQIQAGLKAGDWIKHVAPIVGGGGGGRPDSAQAGGKDPDRVPEAVTEAKRFAAEKLGLTL